MARKLTMTVAVHDVAQSARRIDPDTGFLIVSDNLFTLADVSPYVGREIIGWEDLGLDPDKLYNVYRPAKEIAKSIPSLQGVPVFDEHPPEPITAENFTKYKSQVIGSVGMDLNMQDGAARGGMRFYDAGSMDGIFDNSKRGLSCGYWWDAVVEGGIFKGKGYDIRMTNIRHNHVALVKKGRVNSAMVNDSASGADNGGSKMEEITIKMGDPAVPAPGVTDEKPAAVASDNGPGAATEKPAAKNEITREEKIAALEAELAALKAEGPASVVDEDPETPEPGGRQASNDSVAEVERMRKNIYQDVVAKFRARDLALDEVRPIVGATIRAATMDSAESVYKYALERRGVKIPDGVNLAGLRGMVQTLSAAPQQTVAAMDADENSGEGDDIASLLSGVRTI